MGYQSWIDKANENLTVAEWSHAQGHVNACANRVYYAMFHAAIAALIKNQIQPPEDKFGHEWVQSNFAGQLIHRRKIIAAKFRRYLADAHWVRKAADYEPNPVRKKAVTNELIKARELCAIIQQEIIHDA